MKRAIALLVIILAGCNTVHPYRTGTVCKNPGGPLEGEIDWYYHAPTDATLFKDGDSTTSENDCGYVYKVDGRWKAAAYPDSGHSVRLYHTQEAAVAYVSWWCRP